jgi:hypothetical protein
MKNKAIAFYSLLVVFSVFIISCGDDKKDDPPSYFSPTFSLSNGSTVNVSSFNSKSNKYTILSAQPTTKPEANAAPSTTYTSTLTSFNASIVAPSNEIVSSKEEFVISKYSVYNTEQIACDEKMRQVENLLLAKHTPQFSQEASGINPAAPASPISVGDTWNGVNIVSTPTTISTTCRHISDHAYFFVDNRNTATMSSYLSGYGTAFDAIYHVNQSKFGTERDVDNNGKVIIIFSQELTGGLLGYFYSGDKYGTGDVSDSNEGDIFYMTTDAIYQGSIINGTLAHEFQHMIYFDQHYSRGVYSTFSWLNEALSQAAEYYNGYTDNHFAWIANFLNNGYGSLSLTHWTSSNYGYGALYIRYLIDQYGDTAIKNMCSTANIGVAAVEAATGQDFNAIFNNFTRALVLSDETTNQNPAYKFTTLDLDVVQPTVLNGRNGLTTSLTYSSGTSGSITLYAYSLAFFKWTGNFSTLTLSGTYFNGTYFGY